MDFISLPVMISACLLWAASLATAAEPPGVRPAAAQDGVSICFAPDSRCTDAIVEQLGKARKSICIESGSFSSTPITLAVTDARKRGVDVAVILDPNALAEQNSHALFLISQQVPVFLLTSHTAIQHGIILIDGRTIITGGFDYSGMAEQDRVGHLLVVEGKPDLYAACEGNFQKHLAQAAQYAGASKEGQAPTQERPAPASQPVAKAETQPRATGEETVMTDEEEAAAEESERHETTNFLANAALAWAHRGDGGGASSAGDTGQPPSSASQPGGARREDARPGAASRGGIAKPDVRLRLDAGVANTPLGRPAKAWKLTNVSQTPIVVRHVVLNGEQDAVLAIFYPDGGFVPSRLKRFPRKLSIGGSALVFQCNPDGVAEGFYNYAKDVVYLDLYTDQGNFRCRPDDDTLQPLPADATPPSRR